MRKQWRCFHCDEVFTREQDAAEHFGGHQGALAGCQIKGHEGGLLALIREQEADLARWRDEIHPLTTAMHEMRAEHAQALRRAEEDGYARALRDVRVEGIRSVFSIGPNEMFPASHLPPSP